MAVRVDNPALEAAVRELGDALTALQREVRAEGRARARQKAKTGRLTAAPASTRLAAPGDVTPATIPPLRVVPDKPRDWVPEFLLQDDA